MRRIISILLSALIVGATVFSPQPAQAKRFESYLITLLDTEVVFVDEDFGGPVADTNGAMCQITYSGRLADRRLSLHVWKEAKPFVSDWRVRVHKVKVIGYNLSGKQLYSKNMDGFTFERGLPGDWTFVIQSLPKKVKKIKVEFY